MKKDELKKDPFSPEAEQAVLGGIFIDTEALENVKDIILGANEFYDDKNRIIYSAFLELSRQGMRIDFATVCSILGSTTQNPDVWGGREYLLKLTDAYPTAANINEYAEIVHNDYLKRRLLSASKKIEDYTMNGSESHSFIECIDYAEQSIDELVRNRKTNSVRDLGGIVTDVMKKTRDKKENLGEVVGLETGFTGLDLVTQGFQPEQLIILAARPGGGKSTFALNVAKNIAERNNSKGHVVIFSLEMSVEMITTKLLSNYATIDSKKIKAGELSEIEMQKLEISADRLSTLNIDFSDTSVVTMSDIKTMCRKISQGSGVSLVVIDYLQLIDSSDKKNAGRSRQEDVANISRGLKQLARELKCPILALAQLSRDVEKRDQKKITMADLRESGAIEQDADIILFLSKKDDPQEEGSNRVEKMINLNVAKNREGSNDVDIDLLFEPQFSKFSNVSNNE